MNLLTKILNQRPEDPLSILESLNRTTQWEWFHPKLDTLRDDPEMQPTYEMAEKQKALFIRGGGEGEQEMEEEVGGREEVECRIITLPLKVIRTSQTAQAEE